MVIAPDDFREILKHFLSHVQKRDPVGYDKLMTHMEWETDSAKRLLLNAISMYAELGQMRSTYTHSETLARLNEFVEPEKGSRIHGIRVALSKEEQKIYGKEHIDLTPSQDFSKFNQALHELWQMIAGNEGYDHE